MEIHFPIAIFLPKEFVSSQIELKKIESFNGAKNQYPPIVKANITAKSKNFLNSWSLSSLYK